MKPSILQVEDLVCRHAGRECPPVSFGLEAGGVAVVSADHPVPRGTLIRVLSTLAAPASGTLRVEGVDAIADLQKARRRLSLLDPSALDPADTPTALLRRIGRWRRVDPGLVQAAIERVGAISASRLGSVSPLARFGVALEAALLHAPSLLLCDRALDRLDSPSRPAAQDRFAALIAAGQSMVLADSSPEAAELADLQVGRADPVWLVGASYQGSIAELERSARERGLPGRWRVGLRGGHCRLGPFRSQSAASEALAWLASSLPQPDSARLFRGEDSPGAP